MSQRQPLGELKRRFVGRLAVKRHHRCWHAGHSAQLRTPAIAHSGHFDLVRATADGFFVAMNNHGIVSGLGTVRERSNASDFTRV
jgi:hypothetical protein